MKHLLLSAIASLPLWGVHATRAAEITLIAPGGIRAALDLLVPAFEQTSGHKVTATYASGGGTKQRVIQGEHFDVPIVQPPYDTVVASGHVVAASATPLAGVFVGIAVRAGAPKPDISTAQAVKRLLLGAATISYPNAANGAAAGASFNATLHQLGITEAMKPKIRLASRGSEAMVLLAKGEVEIGITFMSEMVGEPGIEIIGPLPREISTPTDFVAFISAHTTESEAAKALIAFLSSPDAAQAYQSRGMTPGG